MMYVPVVAAPGFEGYIGNNNLLAGDACQITITLEILGIGSIGFADGENHFLLETSLGILRRSVFVPYLLGLAECNPCLGPSCIEGYVGDDFRYLSSCDAVLFRLLQVVGERGVGYALTDERGEGDKAAVAKAKQVVAAPHLAKEYVVVEPGELGGKLAQLCAACRLCYLLLCHNTISDYC